MKKRLLPKAWIKDVYSKDKNRMVRIMARFGTWMANDLIEVIKDEVYVLPSLSFYFNHSSFYIHFAWLDFEFHVLFRDWKREDAYREKMIRKSREKRDD